MFILPRTNDALKINPPVGSDLTLTAGGSDWLWAVTALYSFLLWVVVAWTFFAKNGEKIFHYLFTISLFVGAISYFAMASDLGNVPIETSVNHKAAREIFYVRYINWFVGWTPLITALGLISGVSWSTIVYNIILSWIWVATWLSGALVPTTYKWGFFVFGVFAYFLLAISLLYTGIVTAKRVGIWKQYLALSSWLVFVWALYPIAWGVDDGGNVIGVTEGFIFFGILDVVTTPLLSLIVLTLGLKFDFRALNLYFTQYGRIAQTTDFPERGHTEKDVEVAPTAPAGGVITPDQTV